MNILTHEELQQSYNDFKNKAISITLDKPEIFHRMSQIATSKPLVWEIYMNKCLGLVNKNDPNGLCMEFGVAHGDTANFISNKLPNKVLYGFDSFEGLREDWGVLKIGEFKRDNLPKLNKNVEIINGYFEDTLVPFLRRFLDKYVSFVHIDCDLYSSTAFVLEKLEPLFVPGSIICFDEICCHGQPEDVIVKACMEGEYKAFAEFVKTFNIKYELKFAANMMACVQIC